MPYRDGADDSSGLHIGASVTSHRRGNAVGIVKSEPFRDEHSGDRRWWIWVDYTDSSGVVALDQVRDLRVVKDSQ